MNYEIRLVRTARKELDAISSPDYTLIARAISGLEQNPRPPRVKKLADSGLWRIRVGNFRVVYSIHDEFRIVIIVRIARRREDTYKEL